MNPPPTAPFTYPELSAIIRRVQSRFIRGASTAEVFEPLLSDLIEFTGSDYGFIADMLDDPAHVTRAMFERHRSGEQALEFHKLATLFGAAVTSGTPVIANDPLALAGGHPGLASFLGVPLFHGGDMVGLVGLANRHGGYDDALVDFLQPLFASVGAIIGAVRLEQARRQAEAALLAARTAERANAAKTEFLSRMSHELRTPLNAVLGFAQLLLMEAAQPLTPQQRLRVSHIEHAGAHLRAMVNDVLDLSRIESGGMPLASESVGLPELVQESLALVAHTARDAGVRLEVAPPPVRDRTDHVRADHLRLRQVLVNLLSNAIKYNRPDGSVTVRWSAAAEGGMVRLQVSDTGQGLSVEQCAHLFEPFNRLGAERSSVEGTGIGLVVTQRLVHLMGGAISVDSVPGAGSCFSVSLPAGDAESRALDTVPGPADAAPPANGHLRTVLYAEDNPMNVHLVREVLAMRADCRLVVARSGHEALALARRETPDLLLLDMHLGDMTGVQVMRRLLHEGAIRGVPCVAVSADAMPATIEVAARAGFKAYLTKPLDIDAFLRCIDELWARPRSRAPGAYETA